MSRESTTEGDEDNNLLAHALRLVASRLSPASSVKLIRRLAGGYSDAQVLLCDITAGSHDRTGLNGQFVIKVGHTSGRPQAEAHNAFARGLAVFSARHTPELMLSIHDAGTAVDIYDIAGGSLSARTAEHLDFEDREEICARLARDLLGAQLDAAGQPEYGLSASAVVQAWLGPGFPGNARGARLGDLVTELAGQAPSFQCEGELLPNPVMLLSPESKLIEDRLPHFSAPAHGDLHLRNILARGSKQTRDLDYWLIDVNWSEPAPLLYDHAYLELAALLFGLRNSSSGRILPILARLDNESLTVPVELDLNDTGLVNLLRAIRQETIATLESREQRRADVWNRQFLYARMVAGLNWAAKPLGDRALRRAALLSASWAGRLLVRTHHQRLWVDLAEQCRETEVGVARNAAPITAPESLTRWVPFHQNTEGIDLFLVTDGVRAREELCVLAQGRWATVIDLDPESDVDGLLAALHPALEQLRHVSVFGANQQIVPPGMATNWIMANGWSSHDEQAAESDEEWRRRRFLQRVRELIDETFRSTANQSAGVLCLRGGRLDRRLDRILEYIDEVYDGLSVRLDLAEAPGVEGFDIDAFLSVVAESVPPPSSAAPTHLPGLDSQGWKLTRADLNRLSVDLEVLHSGVLAYDRSIAVPNTDEFWRGRPPTWAELEAWVDVQRDACPDLMRDVANRINNHQLAVVPLDHSPGAGGTTLALRVAWNLHRNYPTVILRSFTITTAERIDEIYQECGFPPLVIAEGSLLPEPEREELLRDLLVRNSRAVLLWVNRTNIDRGQKHKLIDPVKGEELGRFLTEYRRRADNDQARQLLDALSANDQIIPASKLSPFYFGLAVYDERFEGVVPYVRNHMEKLSPAQRKVARFLALVTRYGQGLGLPAYMVRFWLGRQRSRSPSPEEELSDVLGPDLRHLVLIEVNELRLLHPLIAEHVLKGDSETEQYGLGPVCVQFIRQVVDYLGEENSTASRLLGELFIRRTTWFDGGRNQHDFSELIQDLSVEAGDLVFKELTERCPGNPHFWNHRGRYHIYRVRGDFVRAEGYLLRAVRSSRGIDTSTHLHTLGMVRRFWIENILNSRRSSRQSDEPAEVLAEIRILFNLAMEAFANAAKIQTNEYNWVTPIQLIATVVERLWRVSSDESLSDFIARDTETTRWVSGQIAEAEKLLENLQSLNLDSKYYKKLSQRLDMLYGDVKDLVERWKQLRESSDDGEIELAIARTLYAGANRDWSNLSEEELRTVAEMTESSINNGRASDSELRLWFQAYRRLPEYSETRAMERLSWYAVEKNSLDANYYMYILHFLIWDRGDSQNQDRIRYYLEECRRLSRQERRQWSFEWLGVETRTHPLVHFSELGKQRHGPTGFWSRPHELARVSGIIEEIKSPQAGTIKVTNGQLTAFFAPRNKFRQTRDINQLVEFYLGFSYEGLRAWEPTYPKERPDALKFAEPPKRIPVSVVDQISPGSRIAEREESAQGVEEFASVAQPEAKRRRLRLDPRFLRSLSSRRRGQSGADFKDAIIELIVAAQSEGHELGSLEAGKALEEIFGLQAYKDFRDRYGKGKLGKAVTALGFRTKPTRSGFDIDLP